MTGYKDYLKQAVIICKRDAKATKAVIMCKFSLGKIVAEIQKDARYGDADVVKFAEDLSKELGYTVHPQRLWECARVYKTFHGDINRIWILEKQLQYPITWSFLVKNCTSQPDVQNELEFTSYWQEKLSTWEKTLCEIDDTKAKLEAGKLIMPPQVKEDAYAVLRAIDTSDTAGKLKKLFKKIDKLLTEIEGTDYSRDKELITLLKAIEEKIHRLISIYA
mgnify:CR=1 FL=1